MSSAQNERTRPGSLAEGIAQAAGGRSRRRSPCLEIQYHPGDIRQGVRYFFLTGRQVVGWGLGFAAWLVFLVFSLTVTPTVIADKLGERRFHELELRRAQQGERLAQHIERLAELDTESDNLNLQLSKIYLAYGFAEDGSRGKGGYPEQPSTPEEVPESIHSGTIRRGIGLRSRIREQIDVLTVFLEEVQSFEEANRDQVKMTPSVSPLQRDDFVLTSPFGTRRSPFTKEIDFHAGVDLAAAVGTPIFSPADGVVTYAGRYPLKRSVAWWRYGNLVALENGDRFITLFGHCDEVKVRIGDKVSQGDLLATVGSTGWSTNPHLHYEIRRRSPEGEWTPVDPRIYMLDHRWRDEERLLVRARSAPGTEDYEPLPRVISR